MRQFCTYSADTRSLSVCTCRSEVEETLKRISSHKGVQGIVIVNSEGIPIRSTMVRSSGVIRSAVETSLTKLCGLCLCTEGRHRAGQKLNSAI